MRGAVFLGILFALPWAGCVGGSTSDHASDSSLAGEETGGIVGTIVTEELFPLLTANVTLSDEDGLRVGESSVDDDGAFRFAQLAPGKYRLLGAAEGFYARETQIEVVALEVSQATLVLAPRPAREPYVSVSAWAGFNACGLALIITPANCNITLLGQSRWGRNYTIPSGFAAIVGETTWRGGDEMAIYYYNRSQERKNANQSQSGFATILDYYWGQNPGRVVLTPAYRRPNVTGVIAGIFAPVSDGGEFEMRYGVWWNGYFGPYFFALNPVCQQLTYPRCTGVGVTVDFRFTHWLSVFVHGRPDNINEYSVVPDA